MATGSETLREAKGRRKEPSAPKKAAVKAKSEGRKKSTQVVRRQPVRATAGTPLEQLQIIEMEGCESSRALVKLAGLPRDFGDADLMRRSLSGLSIKVIDCLAHWVEPSVLSETVAPASTLRRWRKEHRKTVTGSAADGALRLINVINLAEQAFGDAEKARRWLAKPKKNLDPERPGISPWELIESEYGARIVEGRLHQIAHGTYV